MGGLGADSLDGGDGVDTADYGASDAGVDVDLTRASQAGGHAQGDTLTGVEWLVGSMYNDTLTGDASSNRLDGGVGNDRLTGGTGDDTLIGGVGADSLDGGDGVDTAD
jgi:Ca2+-binding RTX toxin-like protein